MKIVHYATLVKSLIHELWRLIVVYMPGYMGNALRVKHYKKRLKYLGQGVRIDPGVQINGPEHVEIGNNTWIDRNVTIMAGPISGNRETMVIESENTIEPGVVKIGDNVHIGLNSVISGIGAGVSIGSDTGTGPNVMIYAFSNHYRSRKNPSDRSYGPHSMLPHDRQCVVSGPVIIGENVGIGAGSFISPGVEVGRDSCMGVYSLLLAGSRFSENSRIEGHPAKSTSNRFRQDKAANE